MTFMKERPLIFFFYYWRQIVLTAAPNNIYSNLVEATFDLTEIFCCISFFLFLSSTCKLHMSTINHKIVLECHQAMQEV